MINHARTLLLNSDGATRPNPSYFLEEYVDPKFSALQLPDYLARARASLFDPKSADEAYKNFVMRACMSILHSTEFAEYVYALDPRVTYLNRPSVAMTPEEAVTTPLNDLAKTGRAEMVGSGSQVPQRIMWDWDVEVLSGGPVAYSVQVTLRTPYQRQVYSVNFDDGHSDLVPLPGQTQLFFRFQDAISVGMSWEASLFSMQKLNLDAIMQGFESSGSAADQLFGNQEPYKTFGELWRKHVYLNYKMSGYLLAVIYRMEEVRVNGQ